jgi:hypothetical protein
MVYSWFTERPVAVQLYQNDTDAKCPSLRASSTSIGCEMIIVVFQLEWFTLR